MWCITFHTQLTEREHRRASLDAPQLPACWRFTIITTATCCLVILDVLVQKYQDVGLNFFYGTSGHRIETHGGNYSKMKLAHCIGNKNILWPQLTVPQSWTGSDIIPAPPPWPTTLAAGLRLKNDLIIYLKKLKGGSKGNKSPTNYKNPSWQYKDMIDMKGKIKLQQA